MRWPFGPPHMTLKPSKKTQKNKKKQEETKNTQKWAFQLSVKSFFFFGWVSKISLFWQLGPKSAHTKKHYKNSGFRAFFCWKAVVRHETAIFGPKKAKFINSSYLFFFCLFSSLSTTQNTQNCWNPYFYSVLANLKKENFQNLNLKHWKLKNPIFAPFFWKRLFLENSLKIGDKKNTKG